MPVDSEVYAQNPSVVLSTEHITIPTIIGDVPGSPESTDPDEMFGGGMLEPPVSSRRVLQAAMRSGSVMAVSHAVAQGTTGMGFDIVPRNGEIDLKDRKAWPEGAQEQRDRMEVFSQTGYRGDGHYSIRGAFYGMEHDRLLLGWGGINVIRSSVSSSPGLPPPPIAFSRFEACGAKFSRTDRYPTVVPVPVSLSDGRVLWTEVPRYFRRIQFRSSTGRCMWFKEYGDWRNMDARTGKYTAGGKATPPVKWGQPGRYTPGKFTDPKAVPATEVAHFATSFPGIAPYGFSGWHAELDGVDSAAEHIRLLVTYLKSGLHSVILAAANRPFEEASLQAAVQRIDELGRGRTGLGSIITLSLIPQDSATGNPMMPNDQGADRGRLILHELNTKLPESLLNETLADALAMRIAHSERMPGLLLGRSDNYNFATAAAAWTTANRLRFLPHHREHEGLLDSITAEQGITHWRYSTISPEWEEKESLMGVTSAAGQLGGVSVNRAMDLMSHITGSESKRIEEWWGDIPLPLVTLVLNAPDPQGTIDALKLPGAPKIPMDKASVAAPIAEAMKALEERVATKLNTLAAMLRLPPE